MGFRPIKGKGKYGSSEYEGFNRKDLLEVFKDYNSCKLKVFNTLVDKLISNNNESKDKDIISYIWQMIFDLEAKKPEGNKSSRPTLDDAYDAFGKSEYNMASVAASQGDAQYQFNGLREGDIIYQYDGQIITSAGHLIGEIEYKKDKSNIEVYVIREHFILLKEVKGGHINLRFHNVKMSESHINGIIRRYNQIQTERYGTNASHLQYPYYTKR